MYISDALPILLVEDGPLALLSAKAALEDDGYRVITARNGVSALRALEQPLRGLITDIRLPRPVDGWQVARAARERWPGLPIMYITGESLEYCEEGVPGSIILQKPHTAADLTSALDKLMRSGSMMPWAELTCGSGAEGA